MDEQLRNFLLAVALLSIFSVLLEGYTLPDPTLYGYVLCGVIVVLFMALVSRQRAEPEFGSSVCSPDDSSPGQTPDSSSV